MGVLRDSGNTRLRLTAAGPGAAPQDALLEAVKGAAAGEFTVLGEIGRASDGTIAYLARDVSSKKLVALRLTHGDASSGEAGGSPDCNHRAESCRPGRDVRSADRRAG